MDLVSVPRLEGTVRFQKAPVLPQKLFLFRVVAQMSVLAMAAKLDRRLPRRLCPTDGKWS